MKCFHLIATSVALLWLAHPALAQITIDEVEPQRESLQFQDNLKQAPVASPYFNLAQYKAERAAIRKERNFLEISTGLKGTLSSYNDPWIKVAGGDNAISLMGNFSLKHVFAKNLFSLETHVDAKFGYNRMKVETKTEEQTTSEGVWFKNQDEFAVSVAPSFKMTKNWSYGSIIKFRSQFVNGYVSRTQQEAANRKSTFMSPGYFDMSLGITYKCPKKGFPISINMSPIAMSSVFVESREIRENVWDGKPGWQIYGLEAADRTSKYEGGSSIQIDFDRTFGKTEFLRYRTSIHAFYGWVTNIGKANTVSNYSEYLSAMDRWKEEGSLADKKPYLPVHPTVRWTNNIDIKATKYLTTTLNFQLYYNRAQNVEVQTNTFLSIGLTYTFRNK